MLDKAGTIGTAVLGVPDADGEVAPYAAVGE
jgi:hypothetical protein